MDTFHLIGCFPVTYTLEFQVYGVEVAWALTGDDGTLRCFDSLAEALLFVRANGLEARYANGEAVYL